MIAYNYECSVGATKGEGLDRNVGLRYVDNCHPCVGFQDGSSIAPMSYSNTVADVIQAVSDGTSCVYEQERSSKAASMREETWLLIPKL